MPDANRGELTTQLRSDLWWETVRTASVWCTHLSDVSPAQPWLSLNVLQLFFLGWFVFVLNLLFSGLICTYTVFNSHEVLDEFWYLPNYLPKQLINLWMKGGQRHYLFVFTVVSMLFLQLKYFIQITWVVVGFHRLSINALINAIFYLGLLPTY